MDCEKFDPLLLDELYEELDELTSAAVKRHVAGCSRCSAILNGLRSTQQGVSLALEPIPAGLEERILAATKEAQKVVPIRSPMSRVLSVAGSWAMRPQTAMAAVFLLMIGTSAFVLKARKEAPMESAVSVTVAGQPSPVATATSGEAFNDDKAAAAAHGPGSSPPAARPASNAMASAVAVDDGPVDRLTGGLAREKAKSDDALGSSFAKDEPGAMPATANAAAPAGAPSPVVAADESPNAPMAKKSAAAATDAFSLGTAAFQSRNYAEATKQFDQAAAGGDQNAALWAAESVKEGQGCAVAVGRFDQVAQRAAGSWVGNEASFREARCQMAMGQIDPPRARLTALTQTSTHAQQAQSSLNELNAVAARRASSGSAVGGAAAAPRAASPAPAKKPASAPAATTPSY